MSKDTLAETEEAISIPTVNTAGTGNLVRSRVSREAVL